MNKLRLSVVCLFAGFLAAYAAGGLLDEPATLVGWVLLAIGCYVFGALMLVVAAAILTLAGCEVRWPGQQP